MKEGKKLDLGLTGLDKLFSTEQERVESQLPKIYDIPLSEIDDFPDHPYKVKEDEDMDQLVQSIKDNGILTQVTLRRKEGGRYRQVKKEMQEYLIAKQTVEHILGIDRHKRVEEKKQQKEEQR